MEWRKVCSAVEWRKYAVDRIEIEGVEINQENENWKCMTRDFHALNVLSPVYGSIIRGV